MKLAVLTTLVLLLGLAVTVESWRYGGSRYRYRLTYQTVKMSMNQTGGICYNGTMGRYFRTPYSRYGGGRYGRSSYRYYGYRGSRYSTYPAPSTSRQDVCRDGLLLYPPIDCSSGVARCPNSDKGYTYCNTTNNLFGSNRMRSVCCLNTSVTECAVRPTPLRRSGGICFNTTHSRTRYSRWGGRWFYRYFRYFGFYFSRRVQSSYDVCSGGLLLYPLINCSGDESVCPDSDVGRSYCNSTSNLFNQMKERSVCCLDITVDNCTNAYTRVEDLPSPTTSSSTMPTPSVVIPAITHLPPLMTGNVVQSIVNTEMILGTPLASPGSINVG